MKTEICSNCCQEVNYPDSWDGIIPCPNCLMELFPCGECEYWRDISSKKCDWDCRKNGCEKFIHRDWKIADVSIGGNLADHTVICFYVVENKKIVIKETWLVHNSNVRKITLRSFYEQVAYDGIYGFLTDKEKELLK